MASLVSLGKRLQRLYFPAGNILSRRFTDDSMQKNGVKKEEAEPFILYGLRRKIGISPQKLNLVARQIRRLPVHQAIIQLHFSPKKAATVIEEVVKETLKRAPNRIKSQDFHIDESYVGRGIIFKSIRYHGRGRFGIQHKRYSHYFLKLKQGPPPPKKTPKKEDHRSFRTLKCIQAGPRTIPNSL